MMDDFIVGVMVGSVLGVIAAYIFTRVIIWLTLREISKQVDIDGLFQRLEKETVTSGIQARLEEHQGMFYVYDISDNQFIAQGTDADALAQAVVQRAGDDRAVNITEGDKDVIERFRKTIVKTDSA